MHAKFHHHIEKIKSHTSPDIDQIPAELINEGGWKNLIIHQILKKR
jgi:hypothetical protein